ncbi:MAG: malto-oligosyltrehalose trehalohydrolase [Cytophagaceae bacterium]
MKSELIQRAIGVNFNSSGEAEVTLWAPYAKSAELKILKDERKIPLIRQNFGYWSATTSLLKPEDLYLFVLDGEKERTDPASLSQPQDVHGPSRAINLNEFQWSDASWKNIPQQEYIIYELHTGTFTPEGTFSGIEEKLDYLLELGINAIEIMPVSQFPGGRNWGYDGVYPFATQDSYGGAKALQHLVNRCHEKGLAVILDVVYNHIGPEGNYLGEFGPYFTDKYHTPWGKAINFDDAWCDGVRKYFTENVLMWFRDFHIDALRMDAVHAIRDFSPEHILREMKRQANELMKTSGRKHYLIVELDLNDVRFINPLDQGGYGMDAQWIDEFHHALRVTAGQERNGYYCDFEGIAHLAKAYKDAYVYDGIYSPHRHKTFGSKADKNPGQQFVVFSQNHDQVGNRMLGERSSQLVSFEMQKLMAGAVIASPFLPMLFMGEEWAESNPFLYFVSHTDPELQEAVRKGRKAEFAAFHALGEAPDPQSEKTFLRSKLQWDLPGKEPHSTMLAYYKALISLRKNHPALKNLNRRQMNVQLLEMQNMIMLHRWHEDKHVLIVMNFSRDQQLFKMPAFGHDWWKLIDSADPKWKGPAAAPDFIRQAETILIQPESLIIYSK